MTFATWLKRRRVELGLTQSQLATLLDRDKQSVSNWECGRNTPWGKERSRIESVLGLKALRPRVIDKAFPNLTPLDVTCEDK